MNTPEKRYCLHRTGRPLSRRGRRLVLSACLLLLLPASAALVKADTYDLHLEPNKFTLYTDPYNGNKIHVGGFSGLYPVPGDSKSFYVVTDRGPAPDFIVPPPPPPPTLPATTYKAFAVPEFGPHLLTVKLTGHKAKIKDIRPLLRPDGNAITGLPTTLPATDVPFDFNLNQLPFDEDSLDAEGITIDPWGNFWICEEYKPSVAMMTAKGTVRMRLVPAGTLTGVEEVPTYDLLPGVLAKRRSNRGFEGITASANGILYAAVQRPLNNPNRAAADANGNARLVAIDLNVLLQGAPGPLVRQYLYQMAPIVLPTQPVSVTVSDLFSTGPTTMLVPERGTDTLYEIDVAGATDITPFEDAAGKLIPPLSATKTTIEQLKPADLAALGIVGVSKTVVIPSLTAIDPLLEKVEGVCIVGDHIALTYDNDFNVAEVASAPANPNPDGPVVQLELVGANYPKIFLVPLP